MSDLPGARAAGSPGGPPLRALQHALLPHPAEPVPAGWQVDVASRWSPGGLLLEYTLGVPAGRLRLPPRSAKPGVRDQLWRRTCAELFIGVRGEPSYLEFNLSPSGDWAAYAFDRYRADPRPHEWHGPGPEVRVLPGEGATRLVATLPSAALRPLLRAGLGTVWQAGVAAVIESHLGLSYWALTHPRAQPDFHDRAGFIADLSVPEDLA